MVKIAPVTTEILLMWTNVARTNVAWTNVTVRVVEWMGFIPKFSFLLGLEVA